MLNCIQENKCYLQFNDEQLEFVYTVIDPKHWAMKFKKKQADVEVVKEARESKL